MAASLNNEFLTNIAEALKSIEKGECNNNILTSLFDLVSIRTEDDIEKESTRTFFTFKLKLEADYPDPEKFFKIKTSWNLAWDLNHVDNWAVFTPYPPRNELNICMIATW